MARKSRKQLAFAFFAEGKRPQDPELKELGIKNKTLYNYHQLFKKNGTTSEDHSQGTTPGTTPRVVKAAPISLSAPGG